jgi:hypothetical protein
MNHNVISIAKTIEFKINQLEEMRVQIRARAENKATAISNYDKALAKSIFLLREKGHPTTIIKELAKGECYEARYEMELADGLYKSLTSNMNCLQAELNGWQSINRHLSEI